MIGKAYANRKKIEDRPKSDFYETPYSLTWELLKLGLFDFNKGCLEPASGMGAIHSILNDIFRWGCMGNDIRITGDDFLDWTEKYPYIITNPPFSLFDEFVLKAKEIATEKIAMIGKVNFFGAYKRVEKGVWKHLKHVYIFNRMVDYRTPVRDDGLFHVGNLVTGWFVWDLSWNEDWWHTSILDVQKYAKLGQYHE